LSYWEVVTCATELVIAIAAPRTMQQTDRAFIENPPRIYRCKAFGRTSLSLPAFVP
jgi:hypothetical protein